MVLGMQNICQFEIPGTTSSIRSANGKKCSFVEHQMSDIGQCFIQQNEKAFYNSLIFVP